MAGVEEENNLPGERESANVLLLLDEFVLE